MAALGGWIVLESGWYNVAATQQHWQPVHTVLEKGMRESVRFHARNVATPPLADKARAVRGAHLYHQHCAQCHGAPGVAQTPVGKSMQPVPGPLVDAARRWQPRELYWITRHGIRMAGMPAWEFHLRDEELWDLVAFLQRFPLHTRDSYRAVVEDTASRPLTAAAPAVPAYPDIERGRMALTQYACQACHNIPGVTGPNTFVGPPLAGLSQRKYVAGVLPNTADNLARWIRVPHEIDPLTTMPTLGVTERDARDMAAYLLSKE
ncbi:c-type cytochrome [Pseudoduganella lutea]|uniref:c-type cytochrome n=1 Tax=Pseudoduganella lutea TaxID=321985 RepID=UPI001E5B7D58|nr:c-type cytochrome [Pseudoduganella lutea]